MCKYNYEYSEDGGKYVNKKLCCYKETCILPDFHPNSYSVIVRIGIVSRDKKFERNKWFYPFNNYFATTLKRDVANK